jgi:hypothetical protein
MEPAKLETSIGTLQVEARGRDWLTMEGPFEKVEVVPDNVFPNVLLSFYNQGNRWAVGETDYWPTRRGGEVPIPQALLDELSRLGVEWAKAHPEEFEKPAREEFDDHIFYIADETLGEIARICGDAHRHIREILGAPEFANHASTPLRRRVQKEAQRLRSLRSQASGAAKAINTLAARSTMTRPATRAN